MLRFSLDVSVSPFKTLFGAVLTIALAASACGAASKIEFTQGDRVCLIGNAYAERLQYFGYFETLLHRQTADKELVLRNLGYCGDEVRFRPRSLDFGTPDSHLALRKADVILAFFGFNESFNGEEGLSKFESELNDFITHTRAQKYNGESAPRIVLISPIAHEDTGNKNFHDGSANNANLERYTDAMARIAANHKVPFVDLFHKTQELYRTRTEPYTFNGIHLSESGARRLAPILVAELVGTSESWDDAFEPLRAEVNEKDFNNFHDYRAVNGYYIYGGRSRRDHSNPPYTDAYVLENERAKLREMAAVVDQRIWKVAAGGTVDGQPDYSSTRQLYKVPTNFTQPVNIKTPEEAMQEFTVAEGYKVNLFASEREWPELENPVNFTFDAQGRLWVATMPSYPQYKPPHKPNDKLLIFEDTDRDGVADNMTVFADGLHLPTGFELGDGGAYVAQEPNLVFLKDTDGDGKADLKKILLHGFDSADSHHAIGAFIWGPGGGLYLHEGTFHHTQVETPWGPQRNAHGAVYRFDPTRHKFETFVSYNFANPWGHCFDRWGQNFVADASGGANYFGTAFSTRHHQFTGQPDYGPFKFTYNEQMKQFFPKRVRPTAGCEVVSSRHFPPEAQGNYLLNNCIGFQGVLQHQVVEEDSGFAGTEIEPILVSSDRNFRPTDLQIGPDGALYVVDWFNPLVGHMQHSLRDPNRDHVHGRIWRVSYPSRRLVEPVQIEGQPINRLFDLLATFEDRTRQHVRTKLREFPTDDVLAEMKRWLARVADDDEIEHHKLEALWVCQHHNAVNDDTLELLQSVLTSPDYRARAAATRVLGYWRDRLSPEVSIGLLRAAANDEHPRVRLEAVRAASWFDAPAAAEAALDVLKHPTDYYIDYTLRHTVRRLEDHWKEAVGSGQPFAVGNPKAIEYIVSRVPTSDLINMTRSQAVFSEMLTRPGVVYQYRHEAIEGLAKLRETTYEAQLIRAVAELDQSDEGDVDAVLNDLVTLFAKRPAENLSKHRQPIAKLAAEARRAVTRRLATTALIAADQSVDDVWDEAAKSADRLRDLIESVPMIMDLSVRESLYSRIVPLVDGLPAKFQPGDSPGKLGQFVRISLKGADQVLTLAEVEVYSKGQNIAPNGKASQSSVASGGNAARAVDGKTDPLFANGGQTHTKVQSNPWWELDLGDEFAIDSIKVFNRNEGGQSKLGERLDNFTLEILDQGRERVFRKRVAKAPNTSESYATIEDPTLAIRRAAIRALSYIPGHDSETFTAVVPSLGNGRLRRAAIESLSRLNRSELPKTKIRPVVDQLVDFIESVPAKRRTQDETLEAIQLGKDLTSLLTKDEAIAVRRRLADLAVDVIVVKPIPHRMQFDRPHIYVQSGKPVEIVFTNTDIMPHNLVVTASGARQEVGILAEKMGASGASGSMQFVPDSAKVLFATEMLQPEQTDRLQITAPTAVGDYPYVCTFPGHWRTMYGTMHVVQDISDIPLDIEINTDPHDFAPRQFVREWTVEDLFAASNDLESGRSFANGKSLFTQMSCVQCHAMQQQGGLFGPDLKIVKQKLAERKMTFADLLESLVIPSKVIEPEYRTQIIFDTDGKAYSGVVTFEDDTIIKLMANPLDENCRVEQLNKSDIDERDASQVSIMPEGLLNTMTKEEILDLLAYIISGADPQHPAFR